MSSTSQGSLASQAGEGAQLSSSRKAVRRTELTATQRVLSQPLLSYLRGN
eukprot:COSAG01_NODE_42817_length_436_cov_0.833828_1_plen_49_part_10